MRTILLSDLHLGAASETDLLRAGTFRDRLAPALEGADRIVLLGDVVELRDRPLGEALERARPFFEWLRGTGAEIVLVPGNHDHQLLDPWLEGRRLGSGAAQLDLEQILEPGDGAPARIAGWAGEDRTRIAYPGLWVREDVYATHGHYLDVHLTLPTFERLGVAAIQRLIGSLPDGLREPADYESVQAPLYALLYGLAQAPREPAGPAGRGKTPSVRAWEALGGAAGRASSIRGRLLGSAVIPGALRVADRLGLGRFRADFSLAEISRAGVEAMGDVVAHLGIEARHVVFGHTHRRGPLPGDDADQDPIEWRTPGDVSLTNTGSWLYAPAILGRASSESPFWPGTVVEVGEEGPPRAGHLLDGLSRADIKAGLSGD